MERAAKDEGWVASLSKSKSGAGGQNSQETTNQGCFQQARKFLAEVVRNQQCTSKKVSEVWKCVFILVWNKNQTFQTPKCFFFVVVVVDDVIVAIETSVFRVRRSGFSFRSFSTYKLTPETLKTFPWKYY